METLSSAFFAGLSGRRIAEVRMMREASPSSELRHGMMMNDESSCRCKTSVQRNMQQVLNTLY
eukprot:scaffold1442_cov123-Amphora_coffeaeformis.AAC.1